MKALLLALAVGLSVGPAAPAVASGGTPATLFVPGPDDPEALVEALGEPAEAPGARAALRAHAGTRAPEARTRWLALVAVSLEEELARDGDDAADAELVVRLGRAVLATDGPPARPDDSLPTVLRELAEAVEARLDPARDGTRPPPGPGALALAAALVAGEDPRRALAWRRAGLELHQGQPGTGPLVVALARQLLAEVPDGGDGGGDDPRERAREAARLLESFVVERPADPLAPEARELRSRALRVSEPDETAARTAPSPLLPVRSPG